MIRWTYEPWSALIFRRRCRLACRLAVAALRGTLAEIEFGSPSGTHRFVGLRRP